MKLKILILTFISLAHFSKGQQFSKIGLASYYGKKFNGKKTANGEKFNMNEFTAAHRTLPFNSLVKVTNLKNGKSVVVRVNDRGPGSKSRIIDLSKGAAEKIGMISNGIVKVKIELIDPNDINRYSEASFDCCHGEISPIDPVLKFDFYGNKFNTHGDSISESFESVFSKEYITHSISKINLNYKVTKRK